MAGKSDTWKDVWSRKQLDRALRSTLERLLAADGFDSGFGGSVSVGDWLAYLESIATRLGIERNDSIFEVGCGAGAFLYPFYERGHRVAGIDYSESLVSIAREVMPGAEIHLGEASRMPGEGRFDIVVSHSVFFYFDDHGYAAAVLRRMFDVAVRAIGIFDVPDADKKEAALRYRKGILGEASYGERYKGLEHLYYNKDWFRQTLGSGSYDIRIDDQHIPGYGNNPYRFNVFIEKKAGR